MLGCGEDHLQIFCPQQGKNTMTTHHKIQEQATVEDVARGMPIIYAPLDHI